MAIKHALIPAHWNYFLVLEEDLLELSRWVEFSASNEPAYSIEIARLLMTAAAEVDVVAKEVCRRIDASAKAKSINAYQKVLCGSAPMIVRARFGSDQRNTMIRMIKRVP